MLETSVTDEYWMGRAIELAQGELRRGGEPFGAIIVHPTMGLIAYGTGTGTDRAPIRHSEILAIQKACDVMDGLLYGCTIYSTSEPCALCSGGITHAKLARVVWGSYRTDVPHYFIHNKKYRALDLLQDTTNPPMVLGGCLRDECIALFMGPNTAKGRTPESVRPFKSPTPSRTP